MKGSHLCKVNFLNLDLVISVLYFIDAIVNVHKINSFRFCYIRLERIFSTRHRDDHKVNAPRQGSFLCQGSRKGLLSKPSEGGSASPVRAEMPLRWRLLHLIDGRSPVMWQKSPEWLVGKPGRVGQTPDARVSQGQKSYGLPAFGHLAISERKTVSHDQISWILMQAF